MIRAGIAVAACIVVGCASDRRAAAPREPAEAVAGAPSFDPAAPPAELAPAVARGDAAIAELQRRLSGHLMAALQQGGAAAAVTVCREVAPRLAAEVGEARGVSIGRTSDRLRNPANVAPAWARERVAAAARSPAAEVRPVGVELGERIGLLRPIVAAPACTRCHGAREDLGGDVAARLASEYPEDQAVGYAAGDHRGFFWVEVPR